MLKYVEKIVSAYNHDNRTTQEKINDLKKLGINVSVRKRNSEYIKGYILGKPSIYK